MIDPGILERLSVFGEAGTDGREALAARMHRKRFRKGDHLIRILEKVDRIHLVLEGLAARESVSVNGVRRIGWVYRPGDLIGARALLDEADESEVRALTDLEVAILAVRDMHRISERHPEVGFAVARLLTERLQGMAERLLAATTLGVESRLARLLLEFSRGAPGFVDNGGSESNGAGSASNGAGSASDGAGFASDGAGFASDGPGDDGFRPLAYALTHETMAEIVGASRPHISSMIGEMEERGALRRGRRGRLVVHPEALARLVDAELHDAT